MIFREQTSQFSQPRCHGFEDGLLGIGRHFLFEVGDAQRVPAPDLAFVGQRRSRDQAQQGRLAGAVSADQANPLAGVDLKFDVGKQREMAVGL